MAKQLELLRIEIVKKAGQNTIGKLSFVGRDADTGYSKSGSIDLDATGIDSFITNAENKAKTELGI
jgi:hypothetical protein